MKTIALLFPGQGSQSQGMMLELIDKIPDIKNFVDNASEQLKFDICNIIKNDSEKLNQTVYTQPILLTLEVALFNYIKPYLSNARLVGLGHSLGEWSALTASHAVPFEKSIDIVSKRAQLMQKAVPLGEGAMCALIGFEIEKLLSYLAELASQSCVIEIANYNSPKQVVVAGKISDIEKFEKKSVVDGIVKKAIRLAVSSPSHCSLLHEAATEFKSLLQWVDFSEPDFDIIHNFNAKTNHINLFPDTLSLQLSRPLLWHQSIDMVINKYKPDLWVEVGPGSVLSRIIKGIDRSISVQTCDTVESLRKIQMMRNG